MRPPWSASTKIIILLLLLGLGIGLLIQFQEVIIPFVIALVLAYVLTPVANRFQQHLGVRRGVASLMAYGLALVVVAAIPMILAPTLRSQSAGLEAGVQRVVAEVEALLGNSYTIAGFTLDVRDAFDQAVGSVGDMLEPLFGQTLSLAMGALSSLVWIIFTLVIAFYLIKDGPLFQAWLASLVPPLYLNDYYHLRDEIAILWAAFFRGQLTLAITVAVIFTLAGWALGLPFALAMGVLAGLLEFLPSLGHAIWLTLAALLALFAGSTWLPLPNWAFALLVVGLHLFFQQFDLNYLIPRIIGRRVHLPPLVVILGIVSGALLAGVLGVVLAAPTIASMRVLGRYIYANLMDMDPFPTPMAMPLPPPNAQWWRKDHPAQPDSPLPSEAK